LLSKKLSKTPKKIITYGFNDDSNVNIKTFPMPVNIVGDYNIYNSLLALAVCRQIGISDTDIKNAISTFVFPKGRGEMVYQKDFSIMVDFAHTPNAFKGLLSTLRPKVKGNIIHVFGSAGLRDRSKRPLMGNMSATFANKIILTAEDPRLEKVANVIADIESGIDDNQRKKIMIERIADRQEAIEKAIKMAKKDDLVLITGKAHESSMNYGHGEEPWDEFEAVKEALRKR
jgi:UDP-N-acetylmuramoyl-L-alanyl-D-glutamate--2,6-diaminopimelate ligase